MKKFFLLPLAASLMAFTLADNGGESCKGYMLIEKDVTLEYKDYDAKEKLMGSHSSKVIGLAESDGILSVTFHSVSKDAKDKVTSEGDFVFTCQGGEIKIDMKSMMGSQMEDMEDMEVTIDQTNLVYPSTFTEGQTLPDAKMTMKVSTGGMVIMTMVMDVVDRKVEKFETITTPAGSYQCVKLSQTNKMDSGMMKMTTKTVDWFSLGVGSVRSESYDDKGALQSYTVLNQVIR